MKDLLKRWARNISDISAVVSIGNALSEGRITPEQASAAIVRLHTRTPAQAGNALARPDVELVGA